MGITNYRKNIFGTVHFSFGRDDFRLVRIATGGGISGVGGSYPVLETYTKPCPKLILGNELSGKFTRGKFLILPKHEFIKVRDMNVLIGSTDDDLRKRLEDFLQANPFIVPTLFNKPFAHLTVATRIDVGGWTIFSRKTVLSFIGLPETIYGNRAEFEIFLKSIQLLKHELNI